MTKFWQISSASLLVLFGTAVYSLIGQTPAGTPSMSPPTIKTVDASQPQLPTAAVKPAVTAPATTVAQTSPVPQVVKKQEIPNRRPPSGSYKRDPNRIVNIELKPQLEVQLSAEEAGTLFELLVEVNQTVTKDQVLGYLDYGQAMAQRNAAEAEVEAAKIKSVSKIDEEYAIKATEVAKKEYEKAILSNAKSANSVSEVEIERLRLTYQKGELETQRALEERKLAGHTLSSKQAELQLANEAIRKRTIKAPFAGKIARITPKKNEWVKPGDPVIRITNQEKLIVEGFVSNSQIERHLLEGKVLTAHIERIAGVESSTVQRPAKIISVGDEFSGGDYGFRAEIVNNLIPGTNTWELSAGMKVELSIQ
jgi:multidrug efflux pump subunit AcrA (membrane-fusion protein)